MVILKRLTKSFLLMFFHPFYYVKDRIKGDVKYTKINPDPITVNIPVTLRSKSKGSREEMLFKIDKCIYKGSHERCSLFDVHYIVYEVNCDLPSDMSENIREHYQQTIIVPRLLSWFYNEDSQLQAVIGFFLDIKLQEMEQKNIK